MNLIGLTNYAARQWAADFCGGARIVGLTPDELCEAVEAAIAGGTELADGYAPFCKHIFLRNPTGTLACVAEITAENRHMLCSGYEARREEEMPVLSRWFEGVEPPRALWLDVIVYSREQLVAEGDDVPDAEWGIVAINGELLPQETPMPPATMLRNALGIAEGGSGVPLDHDAYRRSVEFWQTHATCR